MSSQISLERIIQLRVQASWHEAVAVAQQIGEQARLARTSPGFDTCFVSIAGTIDIQGASRAPFPGEPAADVLRALLDRAQAPRELLALVARSEAPDGKDITEDLKIFTRPDATVLVSALAARALAIEDDSSQLAELERLRAEASAALPAPRPDVSSSRRMTPWAVGGAALAVAGLVLALLMANTGSVTVAAGEVGPQPPTPSAGVGQQVTGRLDALVDKGMAALGLIPTTVTAPVEAKPVEKPAPAPRVARRASKAPSGEALVVVVPPDPTGETNAKMPSAAVVAEFDTAAPLETVHDASTDSEAPILRWPQLPHEPEGEPLNAASPYLELLINELGTVDKVRLRGTRSSYHERMLVSAAKAWVFHPARKDGRAVRYLMKVPIMAQ